LKIRWKYEWKGSNYQAIRGKDPGYIPYHFDLTLKMMDRLAAYYGYDRKGVEEHGNPFSRFSIQRRKNISTSEKF